MAKSVGLGPATGGLWGHREDPRGPPVRAPVLKVWEHTCTPTPTTRALVGVSLAAARPQVSAHRAMCPPKSRGL